ncbi:MAG: RNA polymerase sigma factor [Phycisphaerales bacterium]
MAQSKISTDERTDEELVEAYREGESGAMEIIIRRYERELLAFLTRLMGNRAAAEDVFQDTFIQIHQSASQFDVSRRFKPWLFTIAANKGRDAFRRQGKHWNMVDLSAPVKRGASERGGATFVDLLEGDPAELGENLNAEELRDRVRTVLDDLPYHFREIVLLAYFQRLSYNQIAESLDIPLGTVKSRLHAAIGAFGKAWKATFDTPGTA